MKRSFTLAALSLVLLGTSATAGNLPRTTLVPAATTASCFNGTEVQLDGFGVANFLDDETVYGGGVGLNYLWSPFMGVGTDIYWAKVDGSTTHNWSASAILRLPIESWCSALYMFGGGGVHADSTNVGTAHLGAGFEWRPVGPDGMGIFTDFRYTWADEEEGVEDAPQLRVGLRAIF